VTAFAAIIPRRPAAERTGVSEIATALSEVYGTPCESAVFDGCVLLAAPLVPGSDCHLLIDSTGGIAAIGQVLLEDRRGLSGALGLPRHSHSLRLSAAAYQRWGATCAERLGGEFALAMWNVRDRAFLCARDGLGLRPLFVATGSDVVVVSNILGAARAHPHVAQDLDERALRGFLAAGGIAETRTAYGAVVPLPAGHTLTIRHGGESTLRRHWLFPAADGPLIRDPRSAIEGYREALETAVGDRLEGRTAILMSSGIDSTTIAAAARRVTTASTLRAFTASYARVPASSEVPLAQTAAAALGIPITPVPADRYAALHHLSHGRPTPQPVDEPSLSDWRTLIGAAATHAGAALYGEDGDALFQPPGWQDLRRATPLFSLAADVARFAFSAHGLPYLGLRLRERVGLTEPRVLPPPPRWLYPDPQAGSADADKACVLGHPLTPLQRHVTRSGAQSRLWPAVSAYLAGILAPELAGHRVELRCPLLDTRVIRFVVNVAPIPWCQRKELARAAYADMLPTTITRRPKRGFAGLDEALARDWQRHHAAEAVETPLPPPLDEWVAVDEWRRALRSPHPQVVAEAWRVLQLANWLAARGNAVSAQGASCTA
jgi:asparagine synthase/glutamine amidotransferase-like protein